MMASERLVVIIVQVTLWRDASCTNHAGNANQGDTPQPNHNQRVH